jgi:tRNA-dihydrouridine synthase B
MNTSSVSGKLIYLAPLQGFTDYAFRKAFAACFEMPDKSFSPFIETHINDKRIYRDVLPERNSGYKLIPQLLGNDVTEMRRAVDELVGMGYGEINWNLGCPYPMVTRKKQGAGLLPFSERIDEIFNELFKTESCRFSVKMRLGMQQPDEWKSLISTLNRYPLTEVILHGRTADQLYKGEVNLEMFAEFTESISHPVCYNGDVFSLDKFELLSERFPKIDRWMLGRGILANPLIIQEIRTGRKADEAEVRKAVSRLHEQLILLNTSRLNGDSHLLNKMKPYWEYFSQAFAGKEKIYKKIRKSTKLDTYQSACNEMFVK